MLARRLRRRPNSKTTLVPRIVFAENLLIKQASLLNIHLAQDTDIHEQTDKVESTSSL